MVGKWVVYSYRAGIRCNIVDLNVKIGTYRAACDAVDLAVEIDRGVEVGGDSIRRQAGVIGVADWVVAPKRGRRREVLVHAAKNVNVGAVACGAEPAHAAPEERRWASTYCSQDYTYKRLRSRCC